MKPIIFTKGERIMKTWKNKLMAVALLLAGCAGVAAEKDATALVLFGCFAIPMFFAKEDWIC
jgi:hypothetical protein